MSSLGTFEYRYTQISENDFSDRQKSILRELSGPVITKALIERGFIPSEGNADFYVLTQQEKEFDLDYGTNDSSRNYDEDSGEYRDDSVDEQPFGSPISLQVEIYESTSDALFWRWYEPIALEEIFFSELRVEQAMLRAIRDFPNRADLNPSLPNIE